MSQACLIRQAHQLFCSNDIDDIHDLCDYNFNVECYSFWF